MTAVRPDSLGEFKAGATTTRTVGLYGSSQEASWPTSLGLLDMQALIRVRDQRTDNQLIETTVGRIFFNEALPEEMPFVNAVSTEGAEGRRQDCYRTLGMDRTSEVVDHIKNIGFRYATQSGVTIACLRDQGPGREARHPRRGAEANRRRSPSSTRWV